MKKSLLLLSSLAALALISCGNPSSGDTSSEGTSEGTSLDTSIDTSSEGTSEESTDTSASQSSEPVKTVTEQEFNDALDFSKVANVTYEGTMDMGSPGSITHLDIHGEMDATKFHYFQEQTAQPTNYTQDVYAVDFGNRDYKMLTKFNNDVIYTAHDLIESEYIQSRKQCINYYFQFGLTYASFTFDETEGLYKTSFDMQGVNIEASLEFEDGKLLVWDCSGSTPEESPVAMTVENHVEFTHLESIDIEIPEYLSPKAGEEVSKEEYKIATSRETMSNVKATMREYEGGRILRENIMTFAGDKAKDVDNWWHTTEYIQNGVTGVESFRYHEEDQYWEHAYPTHYLGDIFASFFVDLFDELTFHDGYYEMENYSWPYYSGGKPYKKLCLTFKNGKLDYAYMDDDAGHYVTIQFENYGECEVNFPDIPPQN